MDSADTTRVAEGAVPPQRPASEPPGGPPDASARDEPGGEGATQTSPGPTAARSEAPPSEAGPAANARRNDDAEPGSADQTPPDDDPSPIPTDEGLRREAATRAARLHGLENLTAAGRVQVHSGSGDAVGRDVNYYFDTPVRLPSGPMGPATFDRLRRPYEPPDSHGRLVESLKDCPVRLLRAEPGTGRTSTAVMALDECLRLAGPGGDIVVLSENLDPGALTVSDLQPATGYLLNSTPRRTRTSQAVLSHLLRLLGDGAYFVWVVDADAELSDDVVRDSVVEHVAPKLDIVLRRHLAVHTDDTDLMESLLASETVQAALAERRTMESVAALAVDLVNKGTSEEDLRRIVARRRMRDAEALLHPVGDSVLGTLRARAFLLACVVLDGLHMVNVTDAAYALANRLHLIEEPAEPPGRPLFTERLQDYLRHVDAELVEPSGEQVQGGDSSRIRMRRGTVAGAVLEVFWRDYASAHEPVLEWLLNLARHDDEQVRVRAAQAVGKLATYDYEYLYRRVIRRWAGTRGILADRLQWCVGWSLEVLYADSRHRETVRDLVRSWTDPRRPFRPVALRAISVTTGPDKPEEALATLHRIAASSSRDERVRMAVAVARATEEIYVAAEPAPVLAALAGWLRSGDPCAELSAAFCTIRLAWQTASEGDWPELLRYAAQSPNQRDAVAAVLRGLLQQRRTLQSSAWDIMQRWVQHADGSTARLPELCDLLAAVLRPARPRAPLVVRLRFYLAMWTSQGRCNRSTAEKIIADVEGRLRDVPE